ncbi:MAG: hypothetical protein GWN87_00345 [Desulfuromonadales bacterium]|nr:hypothetical protein [Desulfuromonadales bacterium]NIS39224.1 hypothetical protein [Desulfuromonadales bacterium]
MAKTMLASFFGSALLFMACGAFASGPHWVRAQEESFTEQQLEADQKTCRQNAAQQVAREMTGRRPGPEHFERKRAIIFSCMEGKGWKWTKATSREPSKRGGYR